MEKYIVYRKQVCRIINEEDGIYTLVPISDDTIKMKVPKDSNTLRNLITKEEVDRLLMEMPEIDVINNNEKIMEQIYKDLMKSGTHEDIIKIIKTTYARNELRKANNKKLSDKDTEYFTRAEKYLYEEFSIVLGLDYEATRKYVIDKVKKYQK